MLPLRTPITRHVVHVGSLEYPLNRLAIIAIAKMRQNEEPRCEQNEEVREENWRRV